MAEVIPTKNKGGRPQRIVTHNGVTDTIRGWCKRLGLQRRGLYWRFKHLPIDLVFTQPRYGKRPGWKKHGRST